MQRDQESERDGDSAREDQIPPRLAGSTGQRKRNRDKRGLLDSGDPPFRTTKLAEQTQWEDHTEHRTPAHVEDLVAGLIDVAREPVDQVNQPEVDCQRGERD
jgi:hypothetical protein